jgi:molybdopterin molybdotransferase
MLELEEALAQILAAVPKPIPENVPLSNACQRVLAETVVSAVDLPPFDNSAMDGYAVRSADVIGAKPNSPVKLKLIGRVVAGDVFSSELAAGNCVRLFTGSPIPRGGDAVVMQEDTRVVPESSGDVFVLEPVKAAENVRPRGEDVTVGSTLAAPGVFLGAARLGLLAAAGVAQVSVGRRPIVGLLATGSELKEPGQSLASGQIYESNRLALAALVTQAGGIPKTFPLIRDSLEATRQALSQAFEQYDVVVTSGGVSVGEMDFVKDAVTASGGELKFWKVAIKPGRPFVMGRRGSKLLFGLPGNPVSAIVTFLLLVRPALLRWQGATEVSLPKTWGVLAEPVANPGTRRHFLRVRVDSNGHVRSAGIQASHVLTSLALADGLLDFAPGTNLPAGTAVQVLCFERPYFP